MTTMSKDHSRADRLREYAARVDAAIPVVAAMGVVVRAREARAWDMSDPPEIVFAQTEVDGRALPAGVWVALRRDDTAGAVEAMTAASRTPFLVAAREELGEGYRLQTVEETRALPEAELLIAQLAAMLQIPSDVLALIAEWGPDEPRSQVEIDTLLDRRLGRPDVRPAVAGGLTMTVAEAVDVLRLSEAQAKALGTLVHRVGVTITA
jgi:hypothetical protein